MSYIYGRGNSQIILASDVLPEKYGSDWYLMQGKKPSVMGHIYEAQGDGTWLDVTPAEKLTDISDKDSTLSRYNNIMTTLGDLPVPESITFMLLYNEVQEYHTHGATGNLLTGISDKSGKTVSQIIGFLTPFLQDMKTALGSMIGRRLP